VPGVRLGDPDEEPGVPGDREEHLPGDARPGELLAQDVGELAEGQRLPGDVRVPQWMPLVPPGRRDEGGLRLHPDGGDLADGLREGVAHLRDRLPERGPGLLQGLPERGHGLPGRLPGGGHRRLRWRPGRDLPEEGVHVDGEVGRRPLVDRVPPRAADGGQHLVDPPALERFGLRFAGPQDE
jgi:hypothetical protein